MILPSIIHSCIHPLITGFKDKTTTEHKQHICLNDSHLISYFGNVVILVRNIL